ncbi:MAG: methyltransferase domain-containing protein [Patescibacteria group bacterium]|nr:methyltransferase domain-containing protein [Patescibacteria group bacterium]
MYFFELGNTPTLSVAEILQVLNQAKIEYKLVNLSTDILILDLKQSILPDKLIQQLGGCVKIGQIISKAIEFKSADLAKIIQQHIKNQSNKIYFGLSNYSATKLDLKKIGLEIKNQLKNQNLNSRFVASTQPILSSVIVKKNKLVSLRGIELCFLNNNYLGQTLAIQDFVEYGYRDFQRPERDMISGVMPPKLAKMMINLANLETDQTLLDPFCGCGTILQEAVVLGYKKVMGCDVDFQAIDKAQENLKWLIQKFNFNFDLDENIFQCDVRELNSKIKDNLIDAIVTEPYLGPTRQRYDLEKLIIELEELYLVAFKEFKQVLKPGGKIVMVWPIFTLGKQEFKLNILDQVTELDFKQLDLLPQEFKQKKDMKITSRGSIIYSRRGKGVLREILMFKK